MGFLAGILISIVVLLAILWFFVFRNVDQITPRDREIQGEKRRENQRRT